MAPCIVQTLSLPTLVSPRDDFLTRLRRGERDAIAEAYERHHGAIRSFARRLVLDVPAAEDLVQEVFLALPGLARRLESEALLRSFLLGITANRGRHHLRSLSRRRAFVQRLSTDEAPTSETPEHASERKRTADRIARAMTELPVDLRVAFVLQEVEGYAGKEIAEMLRVPEGTVRRRVHDARQRLRACLKEVTE